MGYREDILKIYIIGDEAPFSFYNEDLVDMTVEDIYQNFLNTDDNFMIIKEINQDFIFRKDAIACITLKKPSDEES